MSTTYLEAIREGLWEEMERDPNVFCIGEDIGEYGGAFKVTAGFLERFGAKRVVDTPISEAAIVGAALAGSAGVMVNGGLKRFKRMHPVPDRTIDSINENLEWARQQTKEKPISTMRVKILAPILMSWSGKSNLPSIGSSSFEITRCRCWA